MKTSTFLWAVRGKILLGIFAFSIGQLAGFFNVGPPRYAIEYFGDWAPMYLLIHIPAFAIIITGVFAGVYIIMERRDQKNAQTRNR